MMTLKVLIIGGYGTFGFGIAERLSDEPELELILAGRNFEKAVAACAKLSGAATFTPLKLDRDDLHIRSEFKLGFKPDLIIEAAGPFQSRGMSDLPAYCVQHRIHYADLSDNGPKTAVFKESYAEKTKAPKETFLIFALSTCPVLSAIGLKEIESHIGPATDVTIGISPSPKAPLGRNVIAAATSYAGQPHVGILKGGAEKYVAGLTETRNEIICAPGGLPLPRLPFAVADAADSFVLPASFPALQNIWTGAGTRPLWLHRCLIMLSRGVADGVVPKLSRFTNLFHRVRKYFRFGSHRGGMFVRASNPEGEASWHLIAEGDHGPRIPALPCVALVRKMLRGETPLPGSYSGDEIIGLDDLQPEFAKLDITYGLQYDGARLPPYEKVMGARYADLLPAVQALHRTGMGRRFEGRAMVTRGKNPLSHIVAAVMGFPKSGKDVPVTVTIQPHFNGETWVRQFGESKFESTHRIGMGRWARHITESFGPMSVHMAILEDEGRMRMVTQGWSLLGIPLPKFLRPGGDVFETQDADGRFVFHVDLKAPIFGRLCKYEGWLMPQDIET